MSFYQDLSSQTKKYVTVLGMLLLLGLVLSSFAFALGYGVREFRGSDDTMKTSRQISVNGEGKVAAQPDVATFSPAVVTDAKKIRDAQAENNRRSARMVDFLKQKGIEEKDIKTTGYSIFPQYQYFNTPPCYASPCPPQRPPEVVSYQVRHTLEVKVRDLNQVDELLDGVVTAGANEVGSILFGVDNDEEVKAEARKKAIEGAKKKAEVLAKDLGVRLRRIVGFSESGGPVPLPVRAAEFGIGGAGGGDVGAIQPGEQEVRSSVTITYEFR